MPGNIFTDGGPAFPIPDGKTLHEDYGMSLRDYMAGQILAGWFARSVPPRSLEPVDAKGIWMAADIMIKERNR